MQDTTDAAVAALTTKVAYTVGAATALAGLTIGEWAGLVGIGATLATFVANLYFRFRADKRAQTEHELRLKNVSTLSEKVDNQHIGE